MKLFTRYTRLNAWSMLLVFLIGAGALFFTFRYLLIGQVDEALDTERQENLQYIQQYNRLPTPVSIDDQRIAYIVTDAPEPARYSTIIVEEEDDKEDYRQLSFPVTFGGAHYQFFISLPLEQTEALLKMVALVTILTIALMMAAIYLVNRSVVRHLLQPFDSTIEAVRNYSFSERRPLHLPATSIEEFTTLNETLNGLATRGLQDFQLMRNFTSNAAHEMQTPLAVVRAKLESLMQSPELNDAQARQITEVDDSVERLTRLFKSLLLLTKIENGQFPLGEAIDFQKIVAEKQGEMEEMMVAKGVSITPTLSPVSLSCNPFLAEILVGNLLNNALRYNYSGGAIDLRLDEHRLEVSNTSSLPEMQAQQLFQPFYRHADSGQEGNGLGLSIVKQIAVASGYSVQYDFTNGVHRFLVMFKRVLIP